MTARILVVDDVAANRRLLEAQLSAEYFDVISAADGAEALALCARDECDLVLLDVMMPDIDGFEPPPQEQPGHAPHSRGDGDRARPSHRSRRRPRRRRRTIS
jgi:DNA-binding NtrC family response regulator